jgi:hypothetical protein
MTLADAVKQGIRFGVIQPRTTETKDKVYQEILRQLESPQGRIAKLEKDKE